MISFLIDSFLDLPDLASLSEISPALSKLALDPALHRTRILVVAPSRVSHSLFAQSPLGVAMRPTIGDLVHRGVMRGLGIERRWRTGVYFYSSHVGSFIKHLSSQLTIVFAQSVKQYETGLRLQRRHTSTIVSSYLLRRSANPNALETLHQSHVLPDIESSSFAVSRSLLPTMRTLKWSLQKDQFAKRVRDGNKGSSSISGGALRGFARWFESRGKGLLHEDERVRLAICPDVSKIVGFYEELGR
jgi:hypothetical protein